MVLLIPAEWQARRTVCEIGWQKYTAYYLFRGPKTACFGRRVTHFGPAVVMLIWARRYASQSNPKTANGRPYASRKAVSQATVPACVNKKGARERDWSPPRATGATAPAPAPPTSSRWKWPSCRLLFLHRGRRRHAIQLILPTHSHNWAFSLPLHPAPRLVWNPRNLREWKELKISLFNFK